MSGHYNDNWEWVDDYEEDVPPYVAPTAPPSGPPTSRNDEPPPGADPNWPNGPTTPPPPGTGNQPPYPAPDGSVWIPDGRGGWLLSDGQKVGTTTGGGNVSGDYTTARRPLAALNYPQFNAPTFTAPAPFSYADFSYDPFSYESFSAPTMEEAQKEPGFEYALNQGLKAFENSKAYLGTYKTGGTIKGLNDYSRNMASQNYNDVFRRKGETYDRNRTNAAQNYSTNRDNAFGNWSANRENAADAYATNYGISRDVFDRNYQGAKDMYGSQARGAELQFARDWDQYTYEGDDAYRRWLAQVQANS